MSNPSIPSRRDVLKTAGAVAAAGLSAPAIRTARAATNKVPYALIGTGSRGQYLLRHMSKLDGGRCVAVCDIYEPNLRKGAQTIGGNPAQYTDYRKVLERNDVQAVFVVTPLYQHYPITRDALLAGKHVFCEKSVVFLPEEVHGLRKLVAERPKQVMQVGLQRRYSEFYKAAKQMIDKGLLGRVTHVNAQWNRNPGWTLKPDPDPQRVKQANWRLFREYSGGLVAELASHQVDVADWMFGSRPEFVTGVGGLDWSKDGRTVDDNIQFILKYPKGQKMMYQSVCSNRHLSLFGGIRTEFGETIMGTEGTIEITVGKDDEPALALWYFEPSPAKPTTAKGAKEQAALASASLTAAAAGSRGLPLLLNRDNVTGKESFLEREVKFARQWLYKKGVVIPQEPRNPVDVSLDSFFDCCRTLKKPVCDVEVGLADSIMVMLSNQALLEGRRVFFNEIDKMGVGA
jgi:predicted dehydrogenase